jgi:hypothetical protein
MRVKLQLVLYSDDGQEQTVTDVVTLPKDCQRIKHLGLTLKEAKQDQRAHDVPFAMVQAPQALRKRIAPP